MPVAPIGDRNLLTTNNEELRKLSKVAMLNGRVLAGVVIGTSVTLFAHGLGRRPVGFLVLTADAASNVFEDKAQRSDSHIALQGSAACNADIWVF